MGGFSGKARADHERGPRWVFIKKRAESFEEEGEVFLVGFPAADGDDLILFLNGRVELKDIGLNGVGDTVNLFWVGSQASGEGFPKCGGLRSFYKDGGQKLHGFL
jgi:hypothetical protein